MIKKEIIFKCFHVFHWLSDNPQSLKTYAFIKTTYGLEENMFTQCYQQNLNLQNIQTAQTAFSCKKKKKKNNQKLNRRPK